MLPARLFESGFALSSWLSSALCAGDGTLQPHRLAEPPRVQEVPGDEVVRGLTVWFQFTSHTSRWMLTELTVLPLGFNLQGGLWQQSSFAQHHHVPVGPLASYSPHCEPQTHHEQQWHWPQHHHGEHVLCRGTAVYHLFLFILASSCKLL